MIYGKSQQRSHRNCLRKLSLLHITYLDHVTNEEVLIGPDLQDYKILWQNLDSVWQATFSVFLEAGHRHSKTTILIHQHGHQPEEHAGEVVLEDMEEDVPRGLGTGSYDVERGGDHGI